MEKKEEDHWNNNICRFYGKKISDKDHCHLTGKNRGPSHKNCKFKVTQKEKSFIPFIFHNFSNYDCHMFFQKLFDLKKLKVKFDIIPKTNKECISVTCGCIRFIDSYRFLSDSLDKLVKNVNNDDFLILIKEFSDKWQFFLKKITCPYEYFNSVDDYKKPVDNFKKENFFSKLKKNKCPDDEEKERTKEIIKTIDFKNAELTKLYLKSYVIFLTDVVEKFGKMSIEEYGIISSILCISSRLYVSMCFEIYWP